MIKKYKIEFFIFTAAVFLRLAFAFFVYQAQDFNSEQFFGLLTKDGYYEMANNLINHKIFSYSLVEPITPTSIRVPIYPMIIAPFLYFFKSLWPFLIFQIIVSGFLPILGRKISMEITANRKIANLAALFLIIEPVGISLALMVMTETFFTLFFLLFSLYAVKFLKLTNSKDIFGREGGQTLAASAFLLGIITLIKPVTLYLPIILALGWIIYRFFSKQKLLLKYAAAFILIFIAVLSPWLYRNYKVFGAVIFSTSQEEVLFGYLAPSILSKKNNQYFAQAQTDFFASQGQKSFPDINGVSARQFRKSAVEVIINNPKESAQISGISLLSFFTHDGLLSPLGHLGMIKATGLTVGKILKLPPGEFYATIKELFFSPAVLIILIRFLWFVISALFFSGALYLLIKKKLTAAAVFALICVAYFALTTMANGLAVNARFRFPVEAFIFIFAVSFVFDIINGRRPKISGQESKY